MGDYSPTYVRWSSDTGEWDTDSSCNIWYGEQEEVIWYDPATTNWEELYHEEDYRGIADQLLAEDLGLPTL